VQIVEWYDELARLTDNPVVRLNRAVAVGEADGPRAGLAALAALDDSLPRHAAVAAYIHERVGDLATAARLYAEAAHKGTQPRRARPPDAPGRPAQRPPQARTKGLTMSLADGGRSQSLSPIGIPLCSPTRNGT
jgi:hypothetical protein